jgi:hypothetical protein
VGPGWGCYSCVFWPLLLHCAVECRQVVGTRLLVACGPAAEAAEGRQACSEGVSHWAMCVVGARRQAWYHRWR